TKAGLTSTDRALGVVFGFGRGVLLVSLLMLLGQFTPLPAQASWQNSMLVPTLRPIQTWLIRFVPTNVVSNIPSRGDA
ncbi:MAG: CvpA family protein, partial [Gammaproteobacteria bacterium]